MVAHPSHTPAHVRRYIPRVRHACVPPAASRPRSVAGGVRTRRWMGLSGGAMKQRPPSMYKRLPLMVGCSNDILAVSYVQRIQRACPGRWVGCTHHAIRLDSHTADQMVSMIHHGM